MPDDIKLTGYSRGAGCGCKIAPHVLSEILSTPHARRDESLIVGNESNDDAAVIDTGAEDLLISTTDFFMPVVDDAFEFGRVAAANAISDVYAMGGRPVMALAILGWPIDKLPASLAAKVVEGGRSICEKAGIPLAGGHTIDSQEPIFGLSVNGLVSKQHLKRNNTAREGDLIYLTKPIGSGVYTTAGKRGVLDDADRQVLMEVLTTLNDIGTKVAALDGVHAMTDVTGFGLAGHLLEMAQGSGLAAELTYHQVPRLAHVGRYLSQNAIPDATYRNWNAYQKQIRFDEGVPMPEAFQLLPDPQTNGGLLIAVGGQAAPDLEKLLSDSGLVAFSKPIGRFLGGEPGIVSVIK
jgi:selenide, water dikinase